MKPPYFIILTRRRNILYTKDTVYYKIIYQVENNDSFKPKYVQDKTVTKIRKYNNRCSRINNGLTRLIRNGYKYEILPMDKFCACYWVDIVNL